MLHQDENKKLIDIHRKRLQILKQQQAAMGILTPPHIATEIEAIEEEIKKLQGTEPAEFDKVTVSTSRPGITTKKLSPEQFQQLHELLKNAYPSKDDFTLFVALWLRENADDFSPSSGLDVRFLALMNRYEMQMEKLIRAAMNDPRHKANLSFQNDLEKLLEQVAS